VAGPARVLILPYDSGLRDARMGRGPAALLPAMPPGCEVEEVTPGDGFLTEVAGAFALAGELADRVRAAVAAGRFPVVMSGNACPFASLNSDAQHSSLKCGPGLGCRCRRASPPRSTRGGSSVSRGFSCCLRCCTLLRAPQN
jgi:hypothetical protein